MATQTEIYKLNKPDRTDKVGIAALNENMDIIEEELKKRPMGSEIPDAAFSEVDLKDTVTVDYYSTEGQPFDITEQVDIDDLLSKIEKGILFRVRFLDKSGNEYAVILDDTAVITTESETRTITAGIAPHLNRDARSHYSLNVRQFSDGTESVIFAAYPMLTSASEVSEPATATLNFDNWDAEEGACYRETLEDGSSIIHAIERDASGNIISIGGIAIEGVG